MGTLHGHLHRLRQRTLGTPFVRRLAVLMSGTVAGQGLLVLAAPLLTRLYTPADFGVLAVFSALFGMLTAITALRYDIAIPLCRDAEEAVAMVWVGALAAIVFGLVATLACWLAGPTLAALVDIPSLPQLLWLLPLGLLLWGLSLPLDYWSVRQGTFRVNSVNRIVQSLGQLVPQLGGGLLGAGAPALVLGYGTGFLARLWHFTYVLPAAERAALRRARAATVRRLALQHWRYPIYASPSLLLQLGAQNLPAILLAALFGPAVAGLFDLGQRTIALPMRMLGLSTSQVFLGEIQHLEDRAAIYRLFMRTTLYFVLMGLVGMAPLLVAGPALYALVFGEAWRTAGAYVQILIPVFLLRFVLLPVSQTLNIFERQDLHLLSAVIGCLALGASFALGWWLAAGPALTLGLYSAAATAAHLFYLTVTWRVVRQGRRIP